MKLSPADVKTYESPSLFADDVFEVSLRVGIYPALGRAQAQLEVVDARTGDLIGMRSWPEVSTHDLPAAIDALAAEFSAEILARMGPFDAPSSMGSRPL